MEDRVRFLGYVPDKDLPALYAGSEFFIYPSLYEGFGLPILEAMACGAPVAASGAASLTEVGGDAAIYFDPYSEPEISAAITALMRDGSLRETLRSKGLTRAKNFTWKNVANLTIDAYLSTYHSVIRAKGAHHHQLL